MTVPPNNLPFLFAAFAVVWAVFFIYAAYMSWRRQSVQRELQDLRETSQSASGAGPDDNETV
jgi:CcmD family protein